MVSRRCEEVLALLSPHVVVGMKVCFLDEAGACLSKNIGFFAEENKKPSRTSPLNERNQIFLEHRTATNRSKSLVQKYLHYGTVIEAETTMSNTRSNCECIDEAQDQRPHSTCTHVRVRKSTYQ